MGQQKELLSFLPSPDGSVFVSERVSFRTEGTQRVISVQGVVFAHYGVGDRAAEAYAMITLFESGYASQTQIARAFGYSVRSLRRYQERFQTGGVGALVRGSGRPLGSPALRPKQRGRDQTILHLKAKGSSNRTIAGKLGVSETAIRKRLRRLGWQPRPELRLPFPHETGGDASSTANALENGSRFPAAHLEARHGASQEGLSTPRSNGGQQASMPIRWTGRWIAYWPRWD